MKLLSELKIKLFADSADKAQILRWKANPLIKGITTNPTLMRSAGVTNYEAFARDLLNAVGSLPVAFEVIADDFSEMERQARKISAWAENVYATIPITNTRGETAMGLASRLARSGVKVNVTGVLTLDQVRYAATALGGGAPSMISVFAGRIGDTGRDPIPILTSAVKLVSTYPNVELLWADPRELLNIFQANDVGCQIITATESVLSKLGNLGKDLLDYSLETVQTFNADAARSGYEL